MSSPLIFTSSTPNIGLPLLVAGQAQKEFFVNQALGILDALSRNIVVASQSSPPATAREGDSFRVTAPASGAWAGCEDHIAIRIGEDWHLIAPQDGIRVFDVAAEQTLHYRSGWLAAEAPALPVGGQVVDVECRATLNQLIQALRDFAILGPSIE